MFLLDCCSGSLGGESERANGRMLSLIVCGCSRTVKGQNYMKRYVGKEVRETESGKN